MVTFSSGQAAGAMSGLAWVAPSAAASITNPLCDGRPITSEQMCSKVPSWSPANALCISGTIPALPASPTADDFADNWGVLFGVNATPDSATGVLGRSYKNVTFMVSGTPQSGLLASVHRQGESLAYMAALVPGVPISFTKFATDYYATAPTGYLSAADVPKIDRIGIQIPSGSLPVTMVNLCLQELVFTD